MSKSINKLIKKKWKFEDIPNLQKKIIIITGANSGLGLVASRELSKKNAKVIMACRDIVKGNNVRDQIIADFPQASLDVLKLDLASLSSINEFITEFKNKYKNLDVLLNNAGVMQTPYLKTKDGFELQFGVNHLGHFALTGQLLDLLKSTKGSRVVSVSSIVHKMGKINFEDIHSTKKYNKTSAYSQSKLANLLFAYELNRQFMANNYDTISVAVHPGYSNTNLQKSGPTLGGSSKYAKLYKLTDKLFAQSVEKGTLPLLYAAVEADVQGGDYIGPKWMMGTRGYPKRIKSSKSSYNEEYARKLWELSEKETGIFYQF